MSLSARLYHCQRCHTQVIICSRCDRGQRYCPGGRYGAQNQVMAEIRWTLEAELWLKDFYDYIALDNPHAADQVIDGNYNTAQILKDRPKLVTNMKHQKRKKSAFFSMAIIELPMPCYRTELIY